jgi:hypothetical protein
VSGIGLARRFGLIALLMGLSATAASATAASPAIFTLHTGLPVHSLTPGATNPKVTPKTIHSTICVTGWTSSIRPPTAYTNSLKSRQLRTYGFADRNPADYEEDHLIPLELGGSPTDPRNLWPEPHHVVIAGHDWGSYTKDGLEDILRHRVCSGEQSLASAQNEIALNWVKYWKVWRG